MVKKGNHREWSLIMGRGWGGGGYNIGVAGGGVGKVKFL